MSVHSNVHFSKRSPIRLIDDNTEGTQIYISGYKSNFGVGAAFMVKKTDRILKKKKFKLSTNCSYFQSTLIAINRGLEYAIENIFSENVIICLPNASIYCALQQYNSTNQLIQNIYKMKYRANEFGIQIMVKLNDSQSNQSVSQVNKMAESGAKSNN